MLSSIKVKVKKIGHTPFTMKAKYHKTATYLKVSGAGKKARTTPISKSSNTSKRRSVNGTVPTFKTVMSLKCVLKIYIVRAVTLKLKAKVRMVVHLHLKESKRIIMLRLLSSIWVGARRNGLMLYIIGVS